MKKPRIPLPPFSKIHNKTIPQDSESLRFSFKYLDFTNPKFSCDDCADGYLEKLLVRLKDIGGFSTKRFRAEQTSALRNHRITWDRSSEPQGFICLNEQLRQEESWQFGISANEYGRVHGFLIAETFYIVWLDPLHRLFPGQS